MALGDLYFADEFQPSFGVPWREKLARAELEQWPIERVQEYVALRKQTEANAENNPVGAGWILPSWELVMKNWQKYPIIVILGGNRSTKSSLASRLSVWAGATIPQAEIRCYHVNEDRSIEDQQRFIWDALPLSLRNIGVKKGTNHSLQYSQKNGFTDNICILPPVAGARRGGSLKFGNYRQYQQDAQIAEGFKAHLVWGDEEMPQKMFETLQYRMVDYHGRIILTFTTLTGWTPLVQDILGKTRTLLTAPAPLLGGMQVPIMQESLSRPGCVIYYFHTADNAFIDTGDFIKKIVGRPRDEVLARAYGIPTKSVASVFPSFNKEVNVIPHDQLPWLKPTDKKNKDGTPWVYPTTRYMAIDPGGSKNWFMLWVAVDAAGTWWVYREWPDDDDWALPGNNVEGKPGPASKGRGLGIKDYVELIKGMEGGEEIFERYIDPRMGAAERQSQDGATTIISDLDDAGMTVIPAPGVDVENGLQLLNNLFSYNQDKPRDSINSPKIYISDRCQNFIYACSEYTSKGGSGEATKDPIDAARYLAVSNIEHFSMSKLTYRQQFGQTASY